MADEDTTEETEDTTTSETEDTSTEEFDKDRALATIKKQREAEKAANDRAKALEAKLKEFEDRDKTEAQKAAEERDTSKQEATEAKAEVIRLRMLVKYGLDEEDLDLLGAGDEEQIEARAKRLCERSTGKAEDPKRRPKERLRTGATGDTEPEESDPTKLAGQVPRGW